MDRFFDALFLGLSSGSVYALVALGLVVVYRGTGHLNFAQGEMATLSAYITWISPTTPACRSPLATLIGHGLRVPPRRHRGGHADPAARARSRRSPCSSPPSPCSSASTRSRPASGARRPTRRSTACSPTNPTTSGASRHGLALREHRHLRRHARRHRAAVPAVRRRRAFGLAMRGVASNADSARLVGIPTGRVLAGSWGIAGALGALAGVMVAGDQGQVTPTLMFTVFVYASAAATLGGLDSPGGAVIAGLHDRRRSRTWPPSTPRGVGRPGDEAGRRPAGASSWCCCSSRPASSARRRWSGCDQDQRRLDRPLGHPRCSGSPPSSPSSSTSRPRPRPARSAT